MHPRAKELIESLNLQPHPEGGFFREIFRSEAMVDPHDDRPARSALTTIYFLLPSGQVSRWHKVSSDELWHHYEGDPLELLIIDERAAAVSRNLVGPWDDSVAPVQVVPAGSWQAARSVGDYTLVGCTVGPGFDFADFQMLKDSPDDLSNLFGITTGFEDFV